MATFRTFESIKDEVQGSLARQSSDAEKLLFLAEQVFQTRCELELLKRQLSRLGDAYRYKEVLQEIYGPHHDRVLPARVFVDARDALDHTDGFNRLEYDASGPAFRWTGPANRTAFRFWLNRHMPFILRLNLLSGGDEQNSTALSVEIEGRTFPLQRIDGGNILIAGPVPASRRDAETVATLVVPYLSAVPEGAGSEQMVGVRFCSLEACSIED